MMNTTTEKKRTIRENTEEEEKERKSSKTTIFACFTAIVYIKQWGDEQMAPFHQMK